MKTKTFKRFFMFICTVLSIAVSAFAQQSGAGKNLRFQTGGGNTGSVVAIPDSTSLDITNAITLEAWVRRSDAGGGPNRIFLKAPEVYALRIGQGGNDQNIQFLLNPTSGGIVFATGEDVTAFANKWIHIAATWNGNGDKLMRIYINGRESNYSFQGMVNPPLENSTSELWLSLWSEAFNGNIDQARLWNVARTQNQILEWMHKTENLSAESGLVSVWNFNEGMGLTTADLLGLNNGTFYSCDRFGMPGCTGNANAPQWQNSTAPFGVKGAYVGTTNVPTSAGPTGGTITANITSPASISDHLGLYQFGSATGGFVSVNAFDNFPIFGVTQRSNIVWGVYEKGMVIANLTFDYSQVTGISNPSQVKIIRRTDANDTTWELAPETSRNDTARTITINGLQDFHEYALGVNPSAPPCASVPVNLVSWWQLEMQASNMPDSRGLNDGILSNSGGFTTGAVGNALTYSFTTAVTVADNPSLDFTANQDFTIEAFIKTTQLGTTPRMIVDKRSTVSPVKGYALYLLNGRPQFELHEGVGTQYNGGGADLRDGAWHHVAVSIDRANPSGGIIFYVDGQQIGSPQVSFTDGDLSSNGAFFIGRNNVQGGTTNFVGQIDEVGIYNRALSGSEVAAVFNAQQTGKCSPTATDVPANLIGWWAGDGSAKDQSATGNHGTFQGSEKFDVGKSGQAFVFDGSSYVNIPHTAVYDTMTTSFSIETWIKVNSFAGDDDTIISKGTNTWRIQRRPGTNSLRFGTDTTGTHNLEGNANVNDGQWHHVVATFNNGVKRLWIDGVIDNSVTISPPSPVLTNTADIRLGDNSQASGRFFNGLIDEATIYDRALTDSEIQGLHKAGLAGKLKQATTNLGFGISDSGFPNDNGQRTTDNGQNISPQASTVTIGDATITFTSVTAAGITQFIPLNPATQLALPMGHAHTGLVYDISTTAVYSGNVNICFNLPAFANLPMMEFSERRILHLEAGAWVNRTLSHDFANKIICAQTPSLSPFAIVDGIAPTVATVSFGGRVFTPTGAGLRNAVVRLTKQNGETIETRTSAFGYYHFENVEVGQTVIVQVFSKRFQFTPQIVGVSEEIGDLDFFASP